MADKYNKIYELKYTKIGVEIRNYSVNEVSKRIAMDLGLFWYFQNKILEETFSQAVELN